jgi:hypothetical protein
MKGKDLFHSPAIRNFPCSNTGAALLQSAIGNRQSAILTGFGCAVIHSALAIG